MSNDSEVFGTLKDGTHVTSDNTIDLMDEMLLSLKDSGSKINSRPRGEVIAEILEERMSNGKIGEPVSMPITAFPAYFADDWVQYI